MTPSGSRPGTRSHARHREAPFPMPVEQSLPVAGADADLVRRLRAGEEEAFEELVRTETGHLLAVARRFLRNEEDAQDAVQQAFLSAFRGLRAFNQRSRVSTWLHRIVTNAALMKLRTRERRPEASIEELLPKFHDDGHHVERFSEWALTAETRMLRDETRAHVRAAIDALPESYRTVLLLRDVEELSTGDAARALGVSDTSFKVRLHRARQALMKLLKDRLEMSNV
jgi:RNA polymerase sigma-70 factor, ECF subfamily